MCLYISLRKLCLAAGLASAIAGVSPAAENFAGTLSRDGDDVVIKLLEIGNGPCQSPPTWAAYPGAPPGFSIAADSVSFIIRMQPARGGCGRQIVTRSPKMRVHVGPEAKIILLHFEAKDKEGGVTFETYKSDLSAVERIQK